MIQPTLADLERLARQAGQILSDSYEKDHQVNFKGVIDLRRIFDFGDQPPVSRA